MISKEKNLFIIDFFGLEVTFSCDLPLNYDTASQSVGISIMKVLQLHVGYNRVPKTLTCNNTIQFKDCVQKGRVSQLKGHSHVPDNL